jgi:probable rRNA maturation factor
MPDRAVEVSTEVPGSLPLDLLEAAVLYTLEAEGAGDVEISLALVSDATIERLNREYLSREGTTDVISFPLEQPGAPLVGDVYVCVPQAERQAAELGIPLREELLRLAIHGTLHALGYEHPEDSGRDESAMFRRQEEILAALLDRGRGGSY